MKLCEACGSPLWSGHVCPRRAISDRMPVREPTTTARFAWRDDARDQLLGAFEALESPSS